MGKRKATQENKAQRKRDIEAPKRDVESPAHNRRLSLHEPNVQLASSYPGRVSSDRTLVALISSGVLRNRRAPSGNERL